MSVFQQAQLEYEAKKKAEQRAIEERESARLAEVEKFRVVAKNVTELFERLFEDEKNTIIRDGGECEVTSSFNTSSYSTTMTFSLLAPNISTSTVPVFKYEIMGRSDGIISVIGTAKLDADSSYQPSELGTLKDLKLAPAEFELQVKEFLKKLYTLSFEYIDKYASKK